MTSRTRTPPRRRRWLACGILWCVCAVHLCAQEFHLLQDSLEVELRTATTDRARVRLHDRLAEVYIDLMDYPRALEHLRAGAPLAERIQDEQGMAYADLIMGLESYQALEYDKALEGYRACIDRLDKANVDQGFLSPLGLIRMVYNDAGLQEEKHDFYVRKLAYYEEHGPKHSTGACHHGLGGYYYLTGQTEKAIEHYLRAREIFAEFDPVGHANQLLPVSSMYMTWGNVPKAEAYRRQAVAENRKTGNMGNLFFAFNGLAEILLLKGDTASALLELDRTKPLWPRAVPQLVAPGVQGLFSIHLEQGRLDSAGRYLSMLDSLAGTAPMPISSVKGEIELDYCHYRYLWARGEKAAAVQALEGALQAADAEHLIRFMQKYRRELAGHYKEMGKVDRSLELLFDYSRIDDSLKAVFDAQKVAAYERELRERDDALEIQQQQSRLKQQRVLLYAAVAVVLLVAALALVALRSYRSKQRANRIISREMQRSEELLLNILPAEVAGELKEKGQAAAKHFDDVTVVFTDFKDFTSVAEKLSPAELVEELNTCFKAFDHIVAAHGIEKIKTIGDAYMAAGGLPDPHHGSPADVVRAALDMQDFMKRHKAERETAGKPFFEMRVGIHTGPVVAGIVGVKKFAYDIWGDTVNAASRMESSGEVGQVNISEATYALVKDEPGLTFTPRGKVQAKGKGEMEMYFAMRA